VGIPNLAILIVFQSVVAMADAHQSHQSGSDHVEFDHEHDFGPDELASTTTYVSVLEFAGQLDCHHCCHCHGMSPVFLASHNVGFTPISSIPTIAGYSKEYPSLSFSPDLRPPIA
jgi:hypothetical protein